MISYQTGSGKMAFAADRQVLLVLVITAEFLGFFSAKRQFLLRELNHMEDVETLLQEIVSLFSCGDTLLLFLPPSK